MKNRIIFFALLPFLLVNTAGVSAQKSVKSNIRELFAAMDAGQADQFGQYCAADFQISHPFLAEPAPLPVFQGIIQGQKAAFPDMQHEIIDILIEKNKASVRGIFRGTNTGPMQGNPPTGNRVVLPFIVNYDLDKGQKIRHQYVHFDAAAFNGQLMKDIPPMPNKAAELVNTFFMKVVGGQHDVSLLHELLAPQFTSSSFPVPNASREQFTTGIESLLKGFPDIQCNITQQFREDNKVITYAYWEATNTGPFMGMAASGKKVRVEFMDIWTEQDGRLIRNEVVMDIAGLKTQLNQDTAMEK